MNKKKLAIILGSIFLVLIAIYLILNPAWITHPKYMLDKQYCEQDSECRFDYIDCQGVNLYHEKKGSTNFGSVCLNDYCGTSCNEDHQCVLERCYEK
ncbi:hypothetical protein H6501_04085 [Candidatus Woesearchaeota archaeon]|nr:hypothetical protein [Candidatus Woesearchaeota archaeon]USN43827.1 MAG: hypothetical protein H6500_05555 [Candidatus Woesearchaeota archaeon]